MQPHGDFLPAPTVPDWIAGIERFLWVPERARFMKIDAREGDLEATVSKTIGAMRVLCVAVDDEPGPNRQRGRIEANSIALLSARSAAVDPPSRGWLGHAARSERIRTSGLWNINHVHQHYERSFLAPLVTAVERTPKPAD